MKRLVDQQADLAGREARAEGGRRSQRERTITETDLNMAMVVLIRGTKSSRLSRSVEDEGMRRR